MKRGGDSLTKASLGFSGLSLAVLLVLSKAIM
jgi:hypothetical protein